MDAAKTGELIRTIRNEKGMNQEQLARSIHVSRSAVSKWERGAGFPDVSVLENLADALDISVSELMHGQREETDQSAEQNYRELSRLSKVEVRTGIRRFIFGFLAAFILICVIGLGWFFRHPVFTLVKSDAYQAVYQSSGSRYQFYTYEYHDGRIRKIPWYNINGASRHHFHATEDGIEWDTDSDFDKQEYDENTLIPMQYAAYLKCTGEEQILALDAQHSMQTDINDLLASGDKNLMMVTVVYSYNPK